MPRGKNNANNNRQVGPQSEPKGSTGGKSDICVPFLTGKCSFEKGCRKRHPSKEEMPRVLARYKKTRCKFRDECFTEGCLFLHPKEEAKLKQPNFIAAHHFPPLTDTCMSVRSSSPDSASRQSNLTSESAWSKTPAMTADASTTKQNAASHQGSDSPSSQQPQASTAWGNPNQPNGPAPMLVNIQPPQQPMAAYPQGFYAGPPPMPPMMVPNLPPPVIDPNTGYAVDPYYFESFYYHQQQLQQHMVPPYPINGMMGPPMGIPFNAEAKEFIPGMSTKA